MPGTSTSAARGLDGVVAARTRLSHVDGDRGELIIGGYELKELAGRVSFEAAAHLLWRGTLPARDELERLRREFAALRALPEQPSRQQNPEPRLGEMMIGRQSFRQTPLAHDQEGNAIRHRPGFV